MTLRKRLLWLFAPLLLIALGLTYPLSQSLILSRFDRQDAALLSAEAEHLQVLLAHTLARNLDLVQSYAKWDETYELLRGQQPDFARQHMDPDALRRANFDFMVILDRQQHIQVEQWLPPDLPDLLTLDTAPPDSHAGLRTGILELTRRLLVNDHREGSRGQLVVIAGVPLILAMSDISNNQDSQPSLGTLVAGHFIDNERLRQLSSQINGTLHLLPAGQRQDDWQLLAAADAANLNRIRISPRQLSGDNRQHLHLLLSNSLDEPQLTMELSRERQLYQEGQKAIAIFLGQTTAIGLAVWLLIYLGLDFGILRRVMRMHREISAIAPDSNRQRISVRGSDELGRLAREINRMLERLERSEQRDREVLDAIQDGYCELSAEGRILATNRALCEMLGYRPTEVLGQSFETVLHSEDIERARTQFRLARESGEHIRFTSSFRHHDGSSRFYDTRFSLIRDNQGNFTGYRGILRDINDQVTYQNQLLDMAYRDPLTELGNRKAFTEHLKQALEQAGNINGHLALLFLDLDRFKEVNDRFGHDIGDSLLRTVAERLRGSLRQPDGVYRLGGDEFTLLMPGGTATTANALAQRILAQLREPIAIGALSIDFVTPSIGIALFPEHADTADSLIKAADSAMYTAKQQRNQACLYRPSSLSSPEQSG